LELDLEDERNDIMAVHVRSIRDGSGGDALAKCAVEASDLVGSSGM
jgi:hypothetical protein